MLRAALTYPVRGPDTEGVFLPGLVLAFGTMLLLGLPALLALSAVVPATLLVGFLGDVYADSIDGGTEPPPFGPLPEVARRGVATGVLAAVYLLPAAVVVAVTVVGAESATVAPGSLSFGSTIRVLVGSTAVLMVVLTSVYLAPVAIGTAFRAGSLRRGLAVHSLAGPATDGAYFTAFWVAVLLVGVATAVASALATVGRPGAVLGVALTFHALVGATHLVGRGFGTDGPLYDLL